jgi:hypothetical protein
MLDAIKEVNPAVAEELIKQNANFFQIQTYINQHNAKIRGDPVGTLGNP